MCVAKITIFHHFSWLNPQLHPPLKEWRYASRAWTTSIRPWRRAKPASCDMADGPAAGRLGMSTGNPWFSGENLWKTYGKPMENLWKTMENLCFPVLFAFIFADESDGFCWFRSELPSSKWPDLVHPSIIFHGLPFSCPCFLPGTEKYMFAELMIKSSKIMRNSTDFHRTWIWWWWFDHVWPRLVRGPWVIQEYFQVGSKGGAGGWSSKLK